MQIQTKLETWSDSVIFVVGILLLSRPHPYGGPKSKKKKNAPPPPTKVKGHSSLVPWPCFMASPFPPCYFCPLFDKPVSFWEFLFIFRDDDEGRFPPTVISIIAGVLLPLMEDFVPFWQ
ncbi:hypothetical protein MLD38_033983 [Melastoma candidum]|uniref:Uncharacterized protein n=1 Tax=Melastoma candidum TaxID=119954 RepID=A0ACB9MAT3_9MYRT|nr:hypothetical protein MLD38_033983 [Melastoma candidum]